jgi:hypothetical protein
MQEPQMGEGEVLVGQEQLEGVGEPGKMLARAGEEGEEPLD